MDAVLKKLYGRSPAFFQDMALSAYSLILHKQRYGKKFNEFRQLLEETQYFTAADLEDYQESQLSKIIKHAYETVPYYQKLFKEKKLIPKDIKTKDDLRKLPILTKKIIKENFNELISSSFSGGRLQVGHTSGTTGSPLEIGYCPSIIQMTYAALDRQYQWSKATLSILGDRIAVVRGNVIVPLTQKSPPFWRRNYAHNQLLLSSFHLSRENMQAYFTKLSKFRPKILDGYPSTLYVLAKHLKNVGEKFPIHAVITSSETLYDFQREIIEDRFECKIFDYYALAERAVFATECEKHKGHHLVSEYGITEILDVDDTPLPAGKIGKMVGTSLHNYGMPLIRYLTDDMTAIKKEICECGRQHPLMEDVATKAEDLLTLQDGRLISSSTLTHPFKPMHSVEASQIIQEDVDHIIIKIVPNKQFSAKDADHLINEFRDRLGSGVHVEIERVEELPKTKSGKFRWVISKVKLGI